jgi:hypothetical protein
VEQVVAEEARDVEIVTAVVIVIANGDAERVHIDVEPATLRDVRERPVVIIAIECGGRAASMGDQVLAVDHQNVQPAIAIGVEERSAGAHGLRQPLLTAAAGVVREVDSGGRCDVCELDVRSWSGLGSASLRDG